MKLLDIKIALKKDKTLFTRVDEEMYNKVLVLEQKHKVDKSVIVRSLIEAGLRTL